MRNSKISKTKRNSRKQGGFTIVELMIATVIFSLVMVICLTGMVQVSRAYYKGLTHSKTQEAGRNLLDEISGNIQLSGSTITFLNPAQTGPTINPGNVGNATGVFCAGNKKYTYAIDRKVVNSASSEANKTIKNAIISEDVKCTDLLTAGNLNADVTGSARSLLGENMRITKFSIVEIVPATPADIKAGNHLWKIDISIAYGDQDLFSTDAPNGTGNYVDDQGASRVVCKTGTGTEFCSIVELSTIVSRRIG